MNLKLAREGRGLEMRYLNKRAREREREREREVKEDEEKERGGREEARGIQIQNFHFF